MPLAVAAGAVEAADVQPVAAAGHAQPAGEHITVVHIAAGITVGIEAVTMGA